MHTWLPIALCGLAPKPRLVTMQGDTVRSQHRAGASVSASAPCSWGSECQLGAICKLVFFTVGAMDVFPADGTALACGFLQSGLWLPWYRGVAV